MLLPPKLACDFLGKKLAGVLGLDAAKYQYAIDQYHQNHQVNIHCNKTYCQSTLPEVNQQLVSRRWMEVASLPLTLHFTFCTIKGTNDQATAASVSDGKTPMGNLTAEFERHRYGTFGRSSCETEPQKCCDEKQTHRNEGCSNSAYQPNEDGVN